MNFIDVIKDFCGTFFAIFAIEQVLFKDFSMKWLNISYFSSSELKQILLLAVFTSAFLLIIRNFKSWQMAFFIACWFGTMFLGHYFMGSLSSCCYVNF